MQTSNCASASSTYAAVNVTIGWEFATVIAAQVAALYIVHAGSSRASRDLGVFCNYRASTQSRRHSTLDRPGREEANANANAYWADANPQSAIVYSVSNIEPAPTPSCEPVCIIYLEIRVVDLIL